MGMANQRGADQVFIGIWVSASVAKKIELARGGTPRSQWLREAIADLLRTRGFETTPEEVSAPSRVRVDLEAKAGVNFSKVDEGIRSGTKTLKNKILRQRKDDI